MKTIVFPRTAPDLDGVACAIAYAEFLTSRKVSALPWIPTRGDAEAEYGLTRCKTTVFADLEDVTSSNRLILVDASGLEGFPEMLSPRRVVEVIDHRYHGNPEEDFPCANVIIENVGAAATLIVEYFRDAHLSPSQCSCELLYGAIHSNTQRLKGSITSSRDISACQWLESVCEIPANLLIEQFGARRAEILEDLATSVARESKQYSHSSGAYVVAQLELMGAFGLLKTDLDRLESVLESMGRRAILNLVELETSESCIIVPGSEMRRLISSAMNVDFASNIAWFRPAILRKQIVAAIERCA